MRHRDSNALYSIHTMFSSEELSSIAPQEIVAWMKLTAFGHSDAGDDDVPTCRRSSTLAFHKKALSYFMPNKHLGWNTVSLLGNPTRSPENNDLIKRVKRHEVRGEGVSSQARCALTLAEFRSLVGMAANSETLNLQVRIPCILKFQVVDEQNMGSWNVRLRIASSPKMDEELFGGKGCTGADHFGCI